MAHVQDMNRGAVTQMLYQALTWAADFLEDLFGLFKDLRPRPLPSEASEWTQDEFFEKYIRAVNPEDGSSSGLSDEIRKIDDATLSKLVYDTTGDGPEWIDEAMAMRLVYEQTTIPIPRLHQVVREYTSNIAHLVMDYIPGVRLEDVWTKLSIWSKLRIAWTLRSYVRQLRRIRHPRSHVPGPLGPDFVPRECSGFTPVFTRRLGPFSDAFALTDALNEKCSSRCGARVPPSYAIPEPLVFTHHDLYMRNIILGHDGRVWLIDWGFSGFYPMSFEFTSAVLMSEAYPGEYPPRSWRRCLPFIADPYFGRHQWLFGRTPR